MIYNPVNKAIQIHITDSGNIIAATEVEGALQENRTAVDLNTVHASSVGTDHTYIDQDLRIAASPTHANVYVPDGGFIGVSGADGWTFDSTNGDISTTSKVGIGIANPGYTLDVNGNIRTQYDLIVGGTPSSQDGDLYLRNAAGANKVLLRSNGVSYFDGGNVGIGMTSPGFPLVINGGGSQFSIQVSGTERFRTNVGNSVYDFSTLPDAAAASNIRFFRLTNTSSTDVGLYVLKPDGTGGTSEARISATGQNSWFNLSGGGVGIGTASPTAKLHINPSGTVTTDAFKIGGSYNQTYVVEVVPTVAYTGGSPIALSFSPNFNLSSNVTHSYGQLNVTDFSGSGNVTTASISALYRTRLLSTFSGTLTQTRILQIEAMNNSTSGGTFTDIRGLYISDLAGKATGTAHAIYQAGTSDINYFAGDVGIGIAAPSEAFHINTGNARIQTVIIGGNLASFTGFNSTDVVIGRTSGGGSGVFAHSGNLVYRPRAIDTVGYGDHVFFTGATPTEKMVIRANGTIGIGTMTPYSKLQVGDDTSGNNWLTIGRVGAAQGGIQWYRNGVAIDAQIYMDVDEKLRISNDYGGDIILENGNVGIGTTSPSVQFEIAGSSGNISFNWGSYVQFSRAGANVLQATDAAGTMQLGAGGNGNDLVVQADHDIVIPNGKVGIGTDSPSKKLEIALDGTCASSYSGTLGIVGTTNTNKTLSFGFDTTSNYGYILAAEKGVAYRDLVLNPLGGKVGIGTTSPDSNLEVANSGANAQIHINEEGGAHVAQLKFSVGTKNAYFQMGTTNMSIYGGSGDSVGFHMNASGQSSQLVVATNGNVGIKTSTPDARLEIQTITTEGKQAVTIDQNDTDQAFIDFQGTSGAGTGYNINTTERNTFSQMILIEINGTKKWIKAYS